MSETLEVFAAAGTADRPDAGIGIVWFATHPADEVALTVIDYQIWDIPEVNASWMEALYERSCAHAEALKPATRGCPLRVEHEGLLNLLHRAQAATRSESARGAFGLRAVREGEAVQWPPTLDERISKLRPLVDSGKVIKIVTGPRRFFFRGRQVNQLAYQIKHHRAGDPVSASELMEGLVLGLLLGTTRRGSYFSHWPASSAGSPPASRGPFALGQYVKGNRPL